MHPVAWWIWALGLATAASLTTNPFLLALILAVAGIVVAAGAPTRRGRARFARTSCSGWSWSRSASCSRSCSARRRSAAKNRALVRFPEVPLPGFMSGVTLGGPVTLESMLVRGVRRHAARHAAVLHRRRQHARQSEASAARASGARCTRWAWRSRSPMTDRPATRRERATGAARPRAAGRDDTRAGARSAAIAMPVLHDALDRSFAARGRDGHTRLRPPGRRPSAHAPGHHDVLMLAGLTRAVRRRVRRCSTRRRHACSVPRCSCSVSAARSARLGSAGGAFSAHVYRPDPWLLAEWGTVACGAAAAVAMIVATHVDTGASSTRRSSPLAWPTLAAPAGRRHRDRGAARGLHAPAAARARSRSRRRRRRSTPEEVAA